MRIMNCVECDIDFDLHSPAKIRVGVELILAQIVVKRLLLNMLVYKRLMANSLKLLF